MAALLFSAVLRGVTVLASLGRPFQPVSVDTFSNLTPVQSSHQLPTPDNHFDATASFDTLPTVGDGLSFKRLAQINSELPASVEIMGERPTLSHGRTGSGGREGRSGTLRLC
jgi:hypothetical protein